MAALRGGLALDLSRLETRRRARDVPQAYAWELLKRDELSTARLMGLEAELASRYLMAGGGSGQGTQEALARRRVPLGKPARAGLSKIDGAVSRPGGSSESKTVLSMDQVQQESSKRSALLVAALQCAAFSPSGGLRSNHVKLGRRGHPISIPNPVAGPFSSGPAMRALPRAVCDWWWVRDAARRRRVPLARSP